MLEFQSTASPFNLAAAVLQLNSGKIKLSNKGVARFIKRMKNSPLDRGKCLLFVILLIFVAPKVNNEMSWEV